MSPSTTPNIIVLLSDEHDAHATGCYGHDIVRTPNLDRLAAEGTRYEHAYCNSPMCVPSRLSMQSGAYVHQVGGWDNGVILGREFRTWGHHLQEAGYECVLSGRTHFNGPDRLLGYDRRLSDDIPGWITHDGQPPGRTAEWRRGSNSHVSTAGPGIHHHTTKDRSVTDEVVEFLHERAAQPERQPFLLHVGYMHPHFPLIAPEEFLSWYDLDEVPLPPTRHEPLEQQHPVVAHLRRAMNNDEPLTDDLQRLATACYWALISHLDHQVGRVLEAIDSSPLREDTVVIYTSDHGEMAGHHGIWQKQIFYEPAVHVPLIVRRPGQVGGETVDRQVSLIDLLPTLRDAAGLSRDSALPGRSLFEDVGERAVVSEYHAQGMLEGGFMIKRGRYKYCYYVGDKSQLFDVEDDPLECRDLARTPEYTAVKDDLDRELRAVLDPEAVNRRAHDDQRARTADRSGACSR